jgi:hypothetical protein
MDALALLQFAGMLHISFPPFVDLLVHPVLL